MNAPPSGAPGPPGSGIGLMPVAAGERIHVLDVLRGFALFGVLLANMIWWFSGYATREPTAASSSSTAWLDSVAIELVSFLVSGKFISIFSFLFGVGFAIQISRARERGGEITRFYVRRMLWLLLFGAAHMVLLWYGDILHLYALLGLLLIGWIRCSDRGLVAWGLVFTIAVPLLIRATLRGLPVLSDGAIDPLGSFRVHGDAVAAMRPVFSHGTYLAVIRLNLAEVWLWFATDDVLMTGSASFGKFLIGFWAARTGILLRAATAEQGTGELVRRGLGWGLALGATCQAIVLLAERLPVLQRAVEQFWILDVGVDLLYRVGVPTMALGYVCVILLLFRRAAWRRRLNLFAPVGRMALTNYLGQSAICVFLFYGFGLGWYGEVGPAVCVGLTVAVFIAQAASSAWWLRRFRFGPAEWAWRRLTYGEPQPLRRTSAVAVHGGASTTAS